MSATFWNMRRRKRAAAKATTEKTSATVSKTEQVAKPVKKGGSKNVE